MAVQNAAATKVIIFMAELEIQEFEFFLHCQEECHVIFLLATQKK